MTKDELITKQQLEIEHLKKVNKEYMESFKSIQLLLVCIGGPLNDNYHRYTREQSQIFHQIMAYLPYIPYNQEDPES